MTARIYIKGIPLNQWINIFITKDKMTDFHDLYLRQKNQGKPRMKTWWECYIEGTDGGKHYHHWTLLSAQTEAERLARLTGKIVYIFECIGKCKADIKWEIPTLW